MPGRIKKIDDSCIEITAWHEGEIPDPPPGYRFLGDDEEPRVGDLSYNVIGQHWSEITELLLAFGNTKSVFRITPVRKIV
jgi:hypothetical protein